MASLIRMPGVSADAEEATLLEWAVTEGGELSPGDVLATLETDKANVDIESDKAGVVWRLLVEPGTSVAVGSPIAVVLAAGETVDDEAGLLGSLGLGAPAAPSPSPSQPSGASQGSGAAVPEGGDLGVNALGTISVGQLEPEVAAELGAVDDREANAATAPPPAATAPDVGTEPREPGGRVFASPLARRLARENGIATETLTGSGPGGRIVRDDVLREVAARAAASTAAPTPAAAALAPAAPADAPTAPPPAGTGSWTDTPHSGMRRAVAAALTASKQSAPHFYLDVTCRVDALLRLREQVNAASEVRVSINDFLVKAVAGSLRDFPEMNVCWTDSAVRRFDDVDVCVAVGTDRGLVTPVLRSADRLSVGEISRTVRDLAGRAAEGRLKQHELEGGTFTISNLGMHGVDSFAAIINPPQVGILAVGAVRQVPVVEDGRVEVGSTLALTVSVDHRPVDGVLAAQWLQLLKNRIENPLSILL